MVNIEYLEFCQGDPYFYDLPRVLDEEPFDIGPLPTGWSSSLTEGWRHVEPPSLRLPVQGWKIHVSTTPENAQDVLSRTAGMCFRAGLAFKFNPTRHSMLSRNAKYADRSGSGKFITIYPGDETVLERVVRELGEMLTGSSGPYILSDLRWGEGPVHVRYGGFKPMFTEGEDGETIPAIIGPGGELVPDRREPIFQVPEWVVIPEFLKDAYERYNDDSPELPFVVEEAIHYSNGGGVYLGRAPRSERPVIIKEGRRYAGLDGLHRSGFERVGHEASMMSALKGIPGVPEIIDVLDVWEHRFLIMSQVDGHALSADVSLNNPASSFSPPSDAVERYVKRVARIVGRVRSVLDEAHSRGISIGDVQPDNILVTESADVSVIDFEAARASDTDRALGTPGFIPPRAGDRYAEDFFALYRIALYLFVPLNNILQLAPGVAHEHIAFAEEFFGRNAAGLIKETRALSNEPSHDHYDGFDAAPRDHFDTTRGRDDLRRGIISTAGRFSDRLFPGDIAQFKGDGAVDIWSGSAGVVLALHRTGGLSSEVAEMFLDGLPASCRLENDSLFTGSLGVATVLDELGETDRLARWLEASVGSGLRIPAGAGLRAGAAGTLMGLLSLRRREPSLTGLCYETVERLLDGVSSAVGTHDVSSSAPSWKAGLFHGWSGVSLALLLAAEQLGCDDVVDAAGRALKLDLACCVENDQDGSFQVKDGNRLLPYLAHGGVGIGLVAQAYLARRDDEELRALLPKLMRPAFSAIYLCAGLTQGRAGMIAALALAEQRNLDAPGRDAIRYHIDHLNLYCALRAEGAFVGGDQNLRFSTDYSTGSAGLLLALASTALAPADRVPWLPGSVPTCLFGSAPSGPDMNHSDSRRR